MKTSLANANERTPSLVSARSVSRSHVGNIRSINEDRVFDDADACVWAVVDGMGGHSGGDIAAQCTIDHLRAACIGRGPLDSVDVNAALYAANAEICTRNADERSQAGATVVSATLVGGIVKIAWAGDSRAYQISAGCVSRLTHDHSVVQELVDAGQLTHESAARHPHANIVTRALGVSDELVLSLAAVAAHDRILLCSDGLSRTLNEGDLLSSSTIDDMIDRLVLGALKRDGTDNISAVIIEFTPTNAIAFR